MRIGQDWYSAKETAKLSSNRYIATQYCEIPQLLWFQQPDS